MRKMFAKTISLMLVFTMALSLSLNAQQGYEIESDYLQEDYYEYAELTSETVVEDEGVIAEFKDLLTGLLIEREAANALGFSIEVDPYAHLRRPVDDERFTVLRELTKVMVEARYIQQSMREDLQLLPILISVFGEPNSRRDTFFIGFTSEEYFELIDFILDHTGITRDELTVGLMEIVSEQDICEIGEEYKARMEELGWSLDWPWELLGTEEVDSVDISERNWPGPRTIEMGQEIGVEVFPPSGIGPPQRFGLAAVLVF